MPQTMKLMKLAQFHADIFDEVQIRTEEGFTTVRCRGYAHYVGGNSCLFAVKREGNQITLYAIAFDDD